MRPRGRQCPAARPGRECGFAVWLAAWQAPARGRTSVSKLRRLTTAFGDGVSQPGEMALLHRAMERLVHPVGTPVAERFREPDCSAPSRQPAAADRLSPRPSPDEAARVPLWPSG